MADHEPRPVRVRRPLHVLAAAGAAAHHGFELGAGVGLVFQPWLGLAGSGLLWGVWIPGWAWAAARGDRRFDPALAFAAGVSLGAVAIHYVLWPWERRGPLPYLTAAEGLPARSLPAYNAVLWGWGAAAVAALALETPRRMAALAVPGAVLALALRGSARRHFEWVREQAASAPRWWNRALA